MKYGNLLSLKYNSWPCQHLLNTMIYLLGAFQGFQLTPTLEEYERLIGIPCDKSPPCLFRGHYPSWALVARLLKVPKSEVLKLKKNQNGVEGIPKVALEERLQRLQKEEDWLAFVDVYELLVYGIMLFPQIERYVDLVAIDAFLKKQDREEHPIVAILANTYYTLDYCSKKNGKGLRCFTSLLFLWLTTYLFHSSKRTRCPIEDHYWSHIKPLTKAEWSTHLDEAIERSICWYSQWNEREDVIIRSTLRHLRSRDTGGRALEENPPSLEEGH
ncbi:hypothetical protein CR513_10388, partial [Mucuna pruriens]